MLSWETLAKNADDVYNNMSNLSSISEHLSPEDTFAEMRMERQAFDGAFLLMEGQTDIKRFDKFFNDQTTSTVVCFGKPKLLEVFKLLEESNLQTYLAFADTDFDGILGKKIESTNLIYSSGHDFDIDFVRTKVFDRYLRETGDDQKCEAIGNNSDILYEIALAIRPLSHLKFMIASGDFVFSASKLDWKNNFDGYDFKIEQFLHKILKKQISSTDDIKKKIDETVNGFPDGLDIWQITNGHDLIKALGICLQDRLGNRKKHNIEVKEIELHLRLTIDDEDFRSLGIFQKILVWSENKSFMVLNERLIR